MMGSPYAVPRYDYPAQFADLDADLLPKLRDVLVRGDYILGEPVARFERELAEYVGTGHVVGVNSGTDALVLALDALGVGPGDEVITVANTFHSTAMAIARVGATPVIVDCEPDSYLIDSLHAPATLAATGFIALVGAQFVGRLVGDRLVDRFGPRTVTRAGGALTAVGMGSALAFPTVPTTIAGFAAAGLGVATLVPAVLHEANELPGLRGGTGLTVVSWLMRLGFLLSPPTVGLVADAADLRVGLLVVPGAGVLVVVFAGALRRRSVAAVTFHESPRRSRSSRKPGKVADPQGRRR